MRQYGQSGQSPTFWSSAVTLSLIAWVQYKGGFYSTMGLPQLVMFIFFGVVLGNAISNGGKTTTTNIYQGIAYTVVQQGALIAGGFYGAI
jgi:isoprenylcysteine carboxyl methyltransferase (ICMT) family protein YpbQ